MASTIGKKRNKYETLVIQSKMAVLARRGYIQAQISEELGIPQQTVSYELKKVRDKYNKTILRAREEAIVEKLAILAEVRKEAWEAWEQSKTRTIVTQDGEQVEVKATPNGDFLNIVRGTVADERKLLGLDEVQEDAAKLGVTVTSINWDDLIRARRPVLDDIEARIEAALPTAVETSAPQEPRPNGQVH